MQFVGIKHNPQAIFNITKEEGEILFLCGSAHYDILILKAAAPGGFIHNWLEQPEGLIHATSREIHKALKALECAGPLFGTNSPRYKIAADLTLCLHKARVAIEEACQNIALED